MRGAENVKSIFTRQDDIIEDYHGTNVADPYRWLEEATSAETQAWVEAQNAVTRDYFAAIPVREKIRERLTKLWNYPRYSVPFKRGDYYFFIKNTGLQNQSVLYKQETLEGEASVLLDPNTFSEDGTVALINIDFSKDGTLLAYSTSQSGSDWQEIKIRGVDTGRDYEEVLQWCKFSGIAWQQDNQGFYYNRFPEAGAVAEEDRINFNRVYWHTLDTPQSADQLIYERPDAKELNFSPHISDDGRYLVLHVWQGT